MKTLNKILFLLLILFAFSCEDIIEKDISNDTIQIISPVIGTVVSSNVTTFQWNSLKGANNYRVQVFNSSQAIVLDSLVKNKVSLTATLIQGQYQWKVRGENFAYQSNYSLPVSFSVVPSTDLTAQQVILTNPTNNYYTNSTSVTLGWQNLSAATSYNLELINVTNGSSVVYQQANILTNSVTLSGVNLAQDAEYQWKIKALNTTAQTPFAIRTLFIDRVVPNLPQNSLPANNSIQLANQALTFNWSSSTGAGTIQSPITYTIEFSNSATFASLIQTSNSVTNTFQQTFTASGDYYWRIKAIDAAGNNSSYSSPFKFTIN